MCFGIWPVVVTTLLGNFMLHAVSTLFHVIGKGKKDEDWSGSGSDVEIKEASDEEIAKPVSKKKSKYDL